jgi:hypothetical protein
MQCKDRLTYRNDTTTGPTREVKKKYTLIFDGPGKRGLRYIFNTFGYSISRGSECWIRFKEKYPD